MLAEGFPGGSDSKASVCNAGDPSSIPGLGDSSTQEHHRIVNTEIRLIVFFAAKDEEALYSQ